MMIGREMLTLGMMRNVGVALFVWLVWWGALRWIPPQILDIIMPTIQTLHRHRRGLFTPGNYSSLSKNTSACLISVVTEAFQTRV